MKDVERMGRRGIAELQRRVMEAEESLRRKEEENEMLRQRLHKYERHWSEYERKMKSMDDTWKMQMSSLEASVSIAKRGLEIGDFEGDDDGSDESYHRRFSGCHVPVVVDGRGEAGRLRGRDGSGFRRTTVRRMSEEFEQRRQVFGDDIKFMVEVKSGEVDAKLEPEIELQKLKQTFQVWKKDFGGRLRETKLILHKLGDVGGGESRRRSSSSSGDKGRKSWWERLNSSRMSFSIQN